MHDDILVGKHWPKGQEEPKQWVGYNVWGNHGFFYTPDTMKHLCSMKVRPRGKEVPEKRLLMIGDEHERRHYADIPWYQLGDLLEASKAKRAKTFKTSR